MGRAKPSKPREIGLAMNANVTEEWVTPPKAGERNVSVPDPEKRGDDWTPFKRGRRAGNCFESLYLSHSIDEEQRAAANEVAEIFAKANGVMGVGERSMERVQYEASDPMTQLRVRSKYGKQLNEILARLDQHHEILLKALLRDFVLGDGADPNQSDGVRWRNVVHKTCAGHPYRQACIEATGAVIKCLRSYEHQPVAKAVEHLPDAIEDYRKMVARNRAAA